MNLLSFFKLATIIWNTVFAPKPTVITFDLNKPEIYQTSVTQVRNAVADSIKCHDMPIIKAPDPKNKYLYIQLNAAAKGAELAVSVTLQLKTADLYLVAYHDKDHQGKDRAFYFKGLITDKNEVFPDVKNILRDTTRCTHDYDSIQSAAKQPIEKLEFRLSKLEAVMRKAYGMATGTTTKEKEAFKLTQAVFLLYSIQIISEAARFDYIEKKTVGQERSDFKVLGLVKNWNALSEQIVRSKDGIFDHSVDVQISSSEVWKVKTVAEIKPDMGILGYVKKPKMVDTDPIDEEL